MATSQAETSGRVCPTCQRTVPADAQFCGWDGTALGAGSKETKLRPAKLCPKCNTTYPSYANFCPADSQRLVPQDLPEAEQEDEKEAADAGISILSVQDIIGTTVGDKYRIDEFIGEGGMAFILKATQVNIDRPVVVKIMLDRLITNEKAILRFERESKITAQISHPNVVSVFDVGFLEGKRPYLVMEFIKGQTLRESLEYNGPVPLAVGAMIMIQICRGLQEAHNLGIIHRDLKPENILLQERRDRPDWVKILDFGIACLTQNKDRLTRTGMVVGTAEYLAPEQLRDQEIDTRADIYALGVMLFEMLTGKPPFEADNLEALLLKMITDRADPPSKFRPDIETGSSFDRIVERCLEKDREKRYQSATELRLELEQLYSVLIRQRKAQS